MKSTGVEPIGAARVQRGDQTRREIGGDLHRRIDLPLLENGRLAQPLEIGNADIGPFRLRANVDKHGFFVLSQNGVRVRDGQIPRVSRRSLK